VALGAAADDRIAGHEGNAVHIQGEEQCINAHAGCGKGGFAACVAAADDNKIWHIINPSDESRQ
jgi:hypothetical protein